jgi:hypothetical protein
LDCGQTHTIHTRPECNREATRIPRQTYPAIDAPGLRRCRRLCLVGSSRPRIGHAGAFARRYEHQQPDDLIHLDIKRLARIVKLGHPGHGDRTRETRGAGYEFLHIAIDDYSRLNFAAILPDQTSASAQRFFHMTRAHSSASDSPADACLQTTDPVIATSASKNSSVPKIFGNALPGATLHAPTEGPSIAGSSGAITVTTTITLNNLS